MTMSKRQIKKEDRQTGKLRNNQIMCYYQTPQHDCLGDRRLSRSQADFLVGDVGSERDS